MELINETPLRGLAFRQFDMEGELDCVVALRGVFMHVQNGRMVWKEEQPPFQWEDQYDGVPQESALVQQTDLTPGKAGTDITFLGASYPAQPPAAEWHCGLAIGPVSKMLRVTGPRQLVPQMQKRWGRSQLSGWAPGPAEPTDAVLMDWRLAYGGAPASGPQDAEPDPRNPIGCGNPGPAEAETARPLAAPQIVLPDGPFDAAPAGLGPVAPYWQGRADHAGTYDKAWQDTRHPLLPRDFDMRFWQCAPPDQIAIPLLIGDEGYRLTALSPTFPDAVGWLPGIALAVQLNGGHWRRLDLDGVHFDWRADHRVTLTWRTRFPLPDADGAKLHIGWRYDARMTEVSA